ncbi:MAG: pilus assembly protein PilM [Candidatus Omnitrophica bacterium]|nr:pilus assembly protein PilM [Candidatus Omnitrophota bacterium]
MKSKHYCILDLGSTKFILILAITKKNRIINIYDEVIPQHDLIRKGIVLNAERFLTLLDKALEHLERKSNIYIDSIYVNIPASEVSLKEIKTFTVLNHGLNKVVSLSDLKKIKRDAELLGIDSEEEILESNPLSYILDNQEGIINPLGMYGRKLGVVLSILCGSSNYINNLRRLLSQIGKNIKGVYLAGKTSYYLITFGSKSLSKEVLFDVGSELSQVFLFREANLVKLETINWGGNNLTERIMQRFHLDWQTAENLKINYAKVIGQEQTDKEILAEKNGRFFSLNQSSIDEIVNSEVRIFCEELKKSLGQDLKEIENIFVIGKTALLEGFLEFLEMELSIPVKLGYLSPQVSLFSPQIGSYLKNNFLDYLGSLGMLLYLVTQSEEPSSHHNLLARFFYKIKQVYQEYF